MAIAVNGLSACATQPTSDVMDDVRRAREFYRYLQPDNLVQPQLRRRSSTFDAQHDHIPSLSIALAPFCQLASLRCRVSKAMLNVMDRDVMYFLAEASLKRSTMDGEETHEFVTDPILMSCSSVPLKGRICELTLRMGKPDDPKQIPTFVIPNLLESQFADMSIVAGPPYYRFYAGVPITTRDGVNIGSLAIMDTVARPDGLTRAEEEFLGQTAEQIMTYLATNRQAIEGRQSRRMAEGLEAFTAGKSSLTEGVSKILSDRTLKRRARTAYGIALESENEAPLHGDQSPRHKDSFRMNNRSNSIISLESEISSAQSTDLDEQQRSSDERDSRSHSKTFARAANLLRECLGDLGEDGSVHFLSLTARLAPKRQKPHMVNGNAVNVPRVASLESVQEAHSGNKAHHVTTRTRVVASSTSSGPLASDLDKAQLSLGLDDDLLRELMRRHPSGRLWTLEDSTTSSSEEDGRIKPNGVEQHVPERVRRSSRRRQYELTALRAAFPSARQVLFTPVWDATIGSFAYGCFITTTLETRSFSTPIELPFLNSFCSTVMAECSRLDTMMADRQKSDFVGTISHEMRSPLHGVLASVEFLAETDMTSFQRSLIETIDSCGRTLLDTINHVLDFSKVNSFQKQWQAANKRGATGGRRNNYLGPENSSKAATFGAPPLLQLFGVTDISAVLEEVVDGLVLGQTYNSGIDITDTSREARGRATGMPGRTSPGINANTVQIVLDVQQGDWNFMTQPGAVRRIIMNVTGNSIKYTAHGTIKVQLQQKEAPEENSATKIMILTVTDTGKGISPEFLASRLFVPFAQENALAPGTGLGMSIVRSIVLMLGGTIDVKSTVNEGTTVEVALPMRRPLPGQVSTTNTPHSGGTVASGNSAGDDSIALLQNQATDETVTFYRSSPSADDALFHAVKGYIREWYNLQYIDQRALESASVVIVEEEDLDCLMTKSIGTPGKRPALVIIGSVSSRNSTSLMSSLEDRLSSPVEFVVKPCGPNKLARSVRQALQKKRGIKPRFANVVNLGSIPEAITPGASTMTTTAAAATATPCDGTGKEMQEMDISRPNQMAMVVHATETFAASQLSQNAQMAIREPSTPLRTPRPQMSDHGAFPFPVQAEENSKQRRESNPSRGASFTGPGDVKTPALTSPTTTQVKQTTAVTSPPSTKVDPRILLVDDNKINLKLLETFLKSKRKYTRIEQAEDGQQAVNAVTEAQEQYDIIFMDISMPIMNGFEATRAIRGYEDQRSVHPGALVIALTGLASGRDQSEGFDSGCDIYMTKPVSFKEVGRLLDNWEGHQMANTEQDTNGATTRLNLGPSSGAGIPVEVNGH